MSFTRTSSTIGLALAALLSAGALAPLPAAAGEAPPVETLRVTGLRRPAEILIDRWGVPHLYARSEEDLFFVQGFNAARDRLFQIDLWRRRGLGQLSEVFGPSFVEQDRAARLFLYRGDPAREWELASTPGTRDAEPAGRRFVEGINAYVDWLDANPARLPWEFRHFGYRPSRWSPDDVVRIRSHGLTRNLASEVARATTLCKTGGLAADTVRWGLTDGWQAAVPDGLEPCLPEGVLKVFQLAGQGVRVPKEALANARAPEKAATNAAEAAEPKADLLLAAGVLPGDGPDAPEGSNNWVVAPSRSATGRPILANDPHRGYSAPSLRYLVHLSAPGLDVVGAGEPALPGVSLGHNGTIAFGITIFNIDQEDLVVYQLDPKDPGRYRYGNGWEPLRVVRETVAVRGEAPRAVELLFSRHGPVIHTDTAKGRAWAVRTCWLEPGGVPYLGSMATIRARDFKAFEAAASRWGAPTLNHVYADVKGNIGWVAAGLAPKRPSFDGLLPAPGDGRYEWAGFWSGAEMPRSFNPKEGWIATANAYNIPASYPARERKLGFEWTNRSRHDRVHEVLASLPKVSLEDSERLQTDLLSIPARRLVALLAPLRSDDEKTARALAFLRDWDAVENADSPQAALELVWQVRHLRKGFREAVLGVENAAALPSTDSDVMLASLEKPSSRFGDDAAAKRDLLLLATLRAAWEEMEKLQGPEPSLWQWGKLHHNLNEHPFAAAVDDATRVKINVGPIAKGGSEFVPSQSAIRPADFREMNGPSVRMVLDVGNWDASRAVNHPGQSGNPDDPHYRDLAPLWRDGKYFPLLYTRKAVEAATERIVRLVPAP